LEWFMKSPFSVVLPGLVIETRVVARDSCGLVVLASLPGRVTLPETIPLGIPYSHASRPGCRRKSALDRRNAAMPPP
jgi:hypothetical protein